MKTNQFIFTFLLIFFSFKIIIAQSENNPLNDKIVIVVHVQEPYARDKLSKEYTSEAVKKINRVIKEARPENVIYAKSIHKVLNLTLKKIYIDRIDIALDNRLEIVNQNIFMDEGGDVFKLDELREFIKGKKNNQIVIVGRVAEECITKTILGGKKLGYEMFMIPDAIIGLSEKSKTKSLKKLEKKGVLKLDI